LLGSEDMSELLIFELINMYDVIEEYFENDIL